MCGSGVRHALAQAAGDVGDAGSGVEFSWRPQNGEAVFPPAENIDSAPSADQIRVAQPPHEVVHVHLAEHERDCRYRAVAHGRGDEDDVTLFGNVLAVERAPCAAIIDIGGAAVETGKHAYGSA